MHDYYQILNVPTSATYPEIKLAYHSLLLKHHPDKRPNNNTTRELSTSTPTFIDDIALLKEAYTTLSSLHSRSSYDLLLQNYHRQNPSHHGPRPAQVVSLEDFTPVENNNDIVEGEEVWGYPCRCGGTYTISESDMDKGQHLVGCKWCSEVIWVGYELAQDEDNVKADDITR